MKVPFHFWISSAALTINAFKKIYLPSLFAAVFSSPGYWMNIFVQRYKTVLNNFKVFKDKHGVSFLQIRFVARGLLCDCMIIW